MARRQNYLNNKDMLKQIHISKSNYCWFEDRDMHHQHDIILYETKEIADAVEQSKTKQSKTPTKIGVAMLTQIKRKNKLILRSTRLLSPKTRLSFV